MILIKHWINISPESVNPNTCPCDALPPRFDDPRLRSPCELRNDRWCLKHGTSCPKLRDGTQHFNIGNGEGSYDCEAN
ncbi:unnamed protein product [Rotaria magnacalcarata]|uniref:Uncharacterized protein n=1 Tax=Rotaria magnacalcarata TaxID=392030 RepID=A0A816U4N0_9BILA|nr:unnamed protein product [Rotaria magnacalcarata]